MTSSWHKLRSNMLLYKKVIIKFLIGAGFLIENMTGWKKTRAHNTVKIKTNRYARDLHHVLLLYFHKYVIFLYFIINSQLLP